MISRYALYNIAELGNRFNLTEGLPKGVKPHYNNSPTISAPVIINHDGARIIKLMKWGLIAKGAKDTNSVFRYKTYNIPSENIFSRHSWELAVRQSRCLVPANGFYELNGSGKKRAYYVQLKDKSLFAFAGIYSSWQDPQGVVHGTYSVITTEATHDMPDSSSRMPVIIKHEDEARWLDPSVTDANSLYDMLRPYPNGLLEVHEVSPAVHSPKPNQPSLIDRIE
jgi:putative SOS response-associated peptidase YedK